MELMDERESGRNVRPVDASNAFDARHRRYIAVIGPGGGSPTVCALAEEVGSLLAREGAILVCGGRGGVMEAAARGARRSGGCTVGILPGHDRSDANPFIDHAITTGLGEARNLVVVSSGDAVIAVGAGYGTLSEIGLAAKIGRPVVILSGWCLEDPGVGLDDGSPTDSLETESRPTALHYTSSAHEAVRLALALAESSGVRTSPDDGR
jgi:uncharacterized protein (TIGR00725 family)